MQLHDDENFKSKVNPPPMSKQKKILTNKLHNELSVTNPPEERLNEAYDFLRLRCVEELGELIQAVSKQRRKDNSETRAHLLEELADTSIIMGWLMAISGISKKDLDGEIAAKINKIQNKIASVKIENEAEYWFDL